ncbi:MAG: hypothetical protein MHM6MM_003503 [Cercozoa sp. M6MM]
MRLNKTVFPEHYNLAIAPCVETYTFNGRVSIDVVVALATQEIVLHADPSLVVSAASVQQGEQCVETAVYVDKELRRLVLRLPEPVEPGNATLRMKYTGEISDSMAGFYRSCGGSNGDTVLLTQFEATDARCALPCFDEPCFKATFSLCLILPPALASQYALSNTDKSDDAVAVKAGDVSGSFVNYSPVKYNSTDDFWTVEQGSRVVAFDTTPRMSVYLLTWVIGDFDVVACSTASGVRVSVYTPPGMSHRATHALDVSRRCLPLYEKLFDIPFPLRKMDLVCIHAFAAGAMEGWGLCTFRQERLLVDRDNTSRTQLMRATRTTCHELAHMWFGNLVTMDFWSALWLNEGFARFMEFVAVDALFPEWKIWNMFASEVRSAALALDESTGTHPVHVDLDDETKADANFDAISYAKGASVLQQLSTFIGDNVFFDGVRRYLKKHKYENAKTNDLWRALQEAVDASGQEVDVVSLMEKWVRQPHFPVVHVDAADKLSLRQETFVTAGIAPDYIAANMDPLEWPVPVTVRSIGDAESKSLLLPNRTTVEVDLSDPSRVYIPNGRAFYRVCMKDETLWEQCLDFVVNKDSDDAVSLIALVDDTFAFDEHIARALKLLPRISPVLSQSSFLCMQVCAEVRTLLGLHKNGENDDVHANLCQAVVEALLPLYTTMHTAVMYEDNKMQAPTFAAVFGALFAADYQCVKDEAASRLKFDNVDMLFESLHALPADVRSNYLCAAVSQQPGNGTLSLLCDAYGVSTLAEERSLLLRACTYCGENEAFANSLLSTMYGESGEGGIVAANQSYMVVAHMAARPSLRCAVFNFVTTHFNQLMRKYKNMTKHIVFYALRSFRCEEKAKQAEDFFAGKDIDDTVATNVRRAVASIYARAASRQLQQVALRAHFSH